MRNSSLVFLLAWVLLPNGQSSFCSFELVGKCGIQHNADNGHSVLANTAVNFTGCQCSGDLLSSVSPVQSTCLGDNMWSQDPPICDPATPCILPDVDFALECYDPLGSSCQLPTDMDEFCVGDGIAGKCPRDGIYRKAVCQCDGYWSVEICPPIACYTVELQQCGSNFSYTDPPSYYETVPPNTTATFDSKCDSGVIATSFCQENGQWLTEGTNTCTLPEASDFALDCGVHSCVSPRRTHFCEDETVFGTCNLDGRYRRATCQCDGYWSAELCPTPACGVVELQQCGSNFNWTASPSYYGTVPPNTTATFDSKCENGVVATSICQENGHWLTQGTNTCLLPEANGITLFCGIGSCSGLGRTHFCQGDNITGVCNLDGVDRRAFCQCDGMWSIEICPPPSCDTIELKQCGQKMEFSSNVSYYGTVDPCTIATFESFGNDCNDPVPVRSVCQPDGHWLTEGIPTCTLPTSNDTSITVKCLDPETNNFINCDYLRRSHFCESERVRWTCNGETVVATCQCDGTWSEQICVPTPPAPQYPDLCPNPDIYTSKIASASSMDQPVTPSSSLMQSPLGNSAATWVPITAVLGALLVVCLLVGLLVAGGVLYHKRTRKPRLSLDPVKFTNTNEVLAIGVNPQVEDSLENRIASEDNKLAQFSKYENSDAAPWKSTKPEQPRTRAFSERYQRDPCMSRQEDDDPLSPDNDSPYEEPPLTEQGLINLLEKYRASCISENALILLDQLGMGEFGEVYRGKLEKNKELVLEVAIKTVKQGPKEEQGRKALLQEAALMAQFKHPNIITMYGVCVGEKLMVVTELMQQGDLRGHLLSIRKDSDSALSDNLPQLLLSFCRHIAAGMSYLSSKMFIHRDLAARNILVSDDLICKIADFGLSRLVDEEDDVYWSSGGMIAVKWAAPESLSSLQYSSASDVWSFAITMFEIWSLGHKPFHQQSNTQAAKKVREGYRLPPPPGCPRYIYELMMECWHPNPDHRPEFGVIVTRLNRPDYVLLKLPQDGDKDALTLKAPLKHSHDLYTDLQQQYYPK